MTIPPRGRAAVPGPQRHPEPPVDPSYRLPDQRSPRPRPASAPADPDPLQPRHAAAGNRQDVPAGALTVARSTRHGWQWLLVLPSVLPLLTPLYNRRTPELAGFPFFYWYLIGCVFVSVGTITAVYLLTKVRE